MTSFSIIIKLLVLLVCHVYIVSIQIPLKIVNEIEDESTEFLGRNLELKKDNLKRIKRIFVIEVSIGSPAQIIHLKLTSIFQGICIANKKDYDEGFDFTISSSFVPIEEKHSNDIGKGSIGIDTFRGLDMTIPYMPIFLLTIYYFDIKKSSGMLGLGYEPNYKYESDKKTSFDFFNYLPQVDLKNQRLIGLRTINDEQGEMSLGDFPSDIQNSMKKYRTCPVVEKDGKKVWACNLSALYFEDMTLYKIDQPVEVIIGGNIIGVSEDIYWKIENKYFKEELKKEICFYDDEDNHNRYNQIKCKTTFDTQKIGVISLIFGKWNMKLDTQKLFHVMDNLLYFSIVSQKKQKNWLISPSLLFDYYVFFDKDRNNIGFHHSPK